MKKLLILSGKGGTGKTTLAASFIELLNAKAFADCDVDAPNLHLIEKQSEKPLFTDFYGSKKAIIDTELCTSCGKCELNCKFNAVRFLNSKYTVDEFACEGCGVCELVCPVDAVSLKDDIAGKLMLYNSGCIFSTAELKMGRGNSGKLVAKVKKQLTDSSDADIAVIDGSPGIGCPVISSVSGVDMVIIVAEPSNSGISDMKRILNTVASFGIKSAVAVNKFDLSAEKTDEIILFCKENKITYLGSIPFDRSVSSAVNNGISVIKADCKAGSAIKLIFKKAMKELGVML